MPALPDDSAFEDFATEVKYSAPNGESVNGLTAHALLNSPLKFSLPSKKGALQLCLLAVNHSAKPEKLIVKYDGVVQEFVVNWNEWGWAPISLLKEYKNGEKIDFEIVPAGKEVRLAIAKAYLRYQDIGFTD